MTNTVPYGVLRELSTLLRKITGRVGLRGLVIRSAKPAGFVAGASPEELGRLHDVNHVEKLIHLGQEVTAQIASLPVPSVALIHGHCLGSGLELALACRYRVADESPGTSLGFPDVHLGLHPCYGATARLPSTVGSWRALKLLTSGRSIDPSKAVRYGLIDAVVPREELASKARDLIGRDPGRHRPPWWSRLARLGPIRWLVYEYFDSQLQREGRPENFPATYAMLRLWRQAAGLRMRERLEAERSSLLEHIQQPSALNLVRAFLLQDRLKRDARALDVNTPERVHIIGAGAIGSGLAALMAIHGRQVTLVDHREEALAAAGKRAERLFEQRLGAAQLVADARARITHAPEPAGLADADFIIEAINEDLEAKSRLYESIEPQVGDEVVIASTSSTLLVEDFCQGRSVPGRFIGLHCLHPVERISLVEVVQGRDSSDEAIAFGQALSAAMDKVPLRVRSGPGLLVNRLQLPYMLKGAEIYERPRRELIDAAAMDFGMPIGPLELADAMGLDVCLALAQRLGKPVPENLRSLVDAGHFGLRTGKGFHDWKRGRRVTASVPPGEHQFEELARELVNPLVEEAVRCRDEGVVADGDLVDVGALFGAGFPAYTGGPLMLLQEWGWSLAPPAQPRRRRNTL
ncbi:3-hydroxyacyl-CoA dehydrogenase NAD-binding domain-containing protein [Aquisalimonas sp.]|uniref:3-hydroxyacyl-CoA dehydrogenase NAD-binding domain-containing protein n=1 Tax=Aquisalimonas sp. TaxID=1872621 RepID=UPI0025B86D75|nr:3-hydroxyacyl-CoA dehydrogenase NAD-binding domain-containing protein [Aquisalimonas sp.]